MLRRSNEKAAKPVIGGVNIAAITPRRGREVEVDLGAMLELVDFLCARAVQGITLFGTTGEFLHFTTEERSRYVALLAKRSRAPVIANVSHSTLDGALMMAEEAAGAGIAAVLLMPPYYFRYSPECVEAFFMEFASHIAKWTPIYIYNIPAFTAGIPIAVFERLLATGMFAGVKDSSGDWETMEALLAMRESHRFTLLAGNDRIYAKARRAGACGVISGAGCAVPELMVALDRSIQNGNDAAVERLDARVQEFIDRFLEFPVPVAIKAAVSVRGIKTGPPACPLGPGLNGKLDEFRAWFGEWLGGVQKECRDA